MRSAARLTYEAVQAAHDGSGDRCRSRAERLAALYGAFAALDRARRARGALELDLAEHRVVLDGERRPIAVVPRARLDSHRLIEEFMILANVAAAEELEARQQACMYRVHDAPDPEKLAALRDFLDEIGIPGLALAKGQVIRPELFNRILRARRRDAGARNRQRAGPAQPGAGRVQPEQYRPFRAGPAALRAFHLADPALCRSARASRADRRRRRRRARPAKASARSPSTSRRPSAAPRRPNAARSTATARPCWAARSARVFEARITGVASFGLFVTLPESGADGLIPISTLPSDYYDHDAARHRLVGRRTGRVFALGDAVDAILVEADAIGGRLVFRLDDDSASRTAAPIRPHRGRPPGTYRRRR